jgi:O-acetyl-ADP-ribose deacetylase (regulator of RNase III)
MTDCWTQEFRDCPVKIHAGSIFDLEADAIVSPANSFGIMDGGLDGKLRDFFGMSIEQAVREKISHEHYGELLVGQAFLTETGHRRFPWLVTAPTMRIPANVSGSVNAYLAMKAILKAARQSADAIKSIAIPGLCSLSGGMPAPIVARQMRAAYDFVFKNSYRFTHWRFDRDFELYLKGQINYIPEE